MRNYQSSSLVANRAFRSVKRRGLAFLLAFGLMAFCLTAVRADWPAFRGPRGDGHVSAVGNTKPVGLPLHWSETNNVKWKTPIPFQGVSTPVVMGGQVWLTTATEEPSDPITPSRKAGADAGGGHKPAS